MSLIMIGTLYGAATGMNDSSPDSIVIGHSSPTHAQLYVYVCVCVCVHVYIFHIAFMYVCMHLTCKSCLL